MLRVYLLLPPRTAREVRSTSRTRAPCRRAAIAAQSAALPPPTTTTSGAVTRPACPKAQTEGPCFLGTRRLAYLLLRYSSTHCLVLCQLPSEARTAFSRPRRAALRRAITLSLFAASASRGTSCAGPATAGRTKRVRLS